MSLDAAICYRAVSSRDSRFDGQFFTAVRTTGIYCRPICPARTPLERNVEFFRHAAAAEAAGYRSCRRCRPEAAPGSRAWDNAGDLVGRGLRLVADGIVDTAGVPGLAASLGVGERQLHRLFVQHLGAGPLAVARTRRHQLALRLLHETDLPITDIAFGSGFSSVRQFNDTMLAAYGRPPSALRGGAKRRHGTGLSLPLASRAPLDVGSVTDYLALRAVPGTEEVTGETYRRAVRSTTGGGILEITGLGDRLALKLTGTDIGSLARDVAAARRMFDLDADPAAVHEVLADDPLLAPLVDKRPGLRVPGAYDGFELAVRAVLGQQVSVAAGSTFAGRLVRQLGSPLPEPSGSVTHLFPSAETVAEADLTGIGLTTARSTTLRTVAEAVAAGTLRLHAGADQHTTERALTSIRGIGPWTASYIAMRALRDPDAFPSKDLALLKAFSRLTGTSANERQLEQYAERWRPWRSYAAVHLWASLSHQEIA
ncbi:MAG: AraC family transcriptional regulator [Frankiales bacterium]|jgi:AraC family transcriptional regulator of adaptative response / DNA-3-methyladenine glycosylase II|nr:AraC family transcriptional regulator [Frankiales bacterium]